MRVFVTGGLGFTGAALTKRLIDDGHQVTVLDKQPGLIHDELAGMGADITLGSVTDPGAVAKCSAGAEIVMHVAAAFRETGAPDALYDDVNVNGTRVVVEAAIAAGARKLIYCSTQGVHGHIDNPPGDETSPIEPEDHYQKTKYLGEEVVHEVAKGRLEYTIVRPTAIYGPGDPERFVMIYRRAARGRFLMFGSGETFYHPVYIDNLVDAFILAMEPGKGAGEAYIIADEEYVPIRTLVRKVGEALGCERLHPHAAHRPPHRGRARLREALQALRHQPADLPPACGLVSSGARVQYREGAAGSRIHAADRTRRRAPTHGRVVP